MIKYIFFLILLVYRLDAQESPHGLLVKTCTDCHSTESWKFKDKPLFSHDSTNFKLLGQHFNLGCKSCHKDLKFQGTDKNCFSCHIDIHRELLGKNCLKCHNNNSWKIGDLIQMHQKTSFPLLQNHIGVDCQSCHPNSASYQYRATSSICIGCHNQDYLNTKDPNHTGAGFSKNCIQCHSSKWKGTFFDHNTTRFQLTGAHIATECSKCHVNGQYQNLTLICFGCHKTNYDNTSNPKHVLSSGFTNECLDCHTTAGWRPAKYDHSKTKFILDGKHSTVQCADCHKNNNYQLVYTDCYLCHQSDFQKPTNPNHVTNLFSHSCEKCHTTSVWKPSTFNHNATRFQLTGAHIATECSKCHVNGQYQNLTLICYGCHKTNYDNTSNPKHVLSSGFTNECLDCHTTAGWRPAKYDHSKTKFILDGKHLTVQCADCHKNNNYQLVYTDCYLCHQSDFQKPTNPNHVTNLFSHSCEKCHTTSVWKPSTFNHNATRFQLTGAHIATECSKCHVNGQYQNLTLICYGCHKTNYDNTSNPKHVLSSGFTNECLDCHTTAGWRPAKYDHSKTKFILDGKHLTVQCADCHKNNNYQLVYTDCYLCHQSDFQKPTNPNHVTNLFSHSCEKCHTTSVWKPSTFNHSATRFQLTGAHIATECSKCHVNGQYSNLPLLCYDCHIADFNGVTSPNHQVLGFLHTCEKCHTTAAWKPATFDHNKTLFPLTGVHISTACQSCHINGNYNLVYNGCYACHQADFQGVLNPNHVSLVFGHNCERCHTTSVWKPSTFNHDAQYFRIYSGNHNYSRNRWRLCTDCHPDVNNYVNFSCITCHRKSDMDSEHQGRANYVYSSPSCYNCHKGS